MSSSHEVGEIFGEGNGPASALLRSPTVIIAAVGLWGMNVYLFRLFGIDYAHVLTFDLMKEGGNGGKGSSSIINIGGLTKPGGTSKAPSSNNSISSSTGDYSDSSGGGGEMTWDKFVILSLSLLVLLHFTAIFWIDVLGGSTIGAIFAFYICVVIGIAIPLPSTAWIRTACMTIFHRTFELIYPRCYFLQPGIPKAVPFVDVFFADILCSLSKVFFDWGMLWHLAFHFPHPVPEDMHTIVIPSIAASFPYLIRARQCIVMHTIGTMQNDPKKYQHMLNAIKYSTSLWPLLLSAYQKVVETDEEKARLETALIVLFAINSTYSLAWDIIMDWGMMQNTAVVLMPESCAPGGGGMTGLQSGGIRPPESCAHIVLRPRLRFGAVTSVVILFIDTILRYSWVLRFYENKLFPNKDVYILCTQFLEALRRSLWNLLRVEWENIKQTRGKEIADSDLEMVENSEMDPFLPVTGMTMDRSPHNKRDEERSSSRTRSTKSSSFTKN